MGVGKDACTGNFEITPYLLFPFLFVFTDESVTNLSIAPPFLLDCHLGCSWEKGKVTATVELEMSHTVTLWLIRCRGVISFSLS